MQRNLVEVELEIAWLPSDYKVPAENAIVYLFVVTINTKAISRKRFDISYSGLCTQSLRKCNRV